MPAAVFRTPVSFDDFEIWLMKYHWRIEKTVETANKETGARFASRRRSITTAIKTVHITVVVRQI